MTAHQPVQARSKATIEVLFEAVAQLLVERGYDALTTNHVARRAGVSIGTLYRYFRSKEDLVGAFVDRYIDRLSALMSGELAAAVDLPLEAGARRVIGAIVRAHEREPEMHRAVLEQIPRVDRFARVRELDRQLESLLTALFESKRDEVRVRDARMFAFLVVQATKGVTLAALVEHPEYLDEERLADALVRMFVGYARTADLARARR